VGALQAPVITSTEEIPDTVSVLDISKSQADDPPTEVAQEEYGYNEDYNSFITWRDRNGKLYIPPNDEELQLRICVAAHCGMGGHRGYTATSAIVKEHVHWPTLDADVKSFVQSCLICLLSSSGNKVPRPLGHQVHAEKVNELLHFDFLYIGESSIGHEYILILKDDFSGYVTLRSCKSANAETTAQVLLEYFTTFVPVLQWFSDQGTHFKNEVMERLASSLGAKQRFSTAYVPWSNGTVESVCKQVLRVMRALSAELRIPETDWTKTVQSIQAIINNSPSRRLGNRAPITVHTGMESGNPLTVALQSMEIRNADSIDQVRTLQNLKVDDMLHSLDNMHKSVSETLSDSRIQAVDRHNRRTHVRPCNPSVGDYVVFARTRGPRTKMSANWVGPRRVSKVLSDFTVELEHLLTEETLTVHVSRIKMYSEGLVGHQVELEDIADFTDRIWYSVDKIKDVRSTSGNFEVLVSWKGLTSHGDSWEPLTIMLEDVPTKVRSFFNRRRRSTLHKDAKASIGL